MIVAVHSGAHVGGLAATGQQYAQIGVNAGGTAATAIVAATSKAAWAIPVVGAAVAGVAAALALWFARKGPHQKVATTQIVDDLESSPEYGLARNLEAYMSGPRTRSSQAAALANFDSVWAFLVSADACGSAEMGNPGKACIADRQRGGKWDWFAMYRDPIASDPDVQPDPSLTDIPALFAGGQGGGIDGRLLLAAGLLAIGVFL